MKTTAMRYGVTLLELIVVIASLVILLGLFLGAIQTARDVAGRSSCLNQCRQIGLALHQYHTTTGSLPPGVVHPARRPGLVKPYGPDVDPYPLMNWHTRLLPYIEQAALWRQTQQAYESDRYSIRVPPHVGIVTPIPLFSCPVDSPRFPPLGFREPVPATTSYLGVSGTTDTRQDGLLFLDSRVRLSQIADGASTTLIVGERPPSLDLIYGRWYGGHGHWNMANAFLGVRETNIGDNGVYDCPSGPYEFRQGSLTDECSAFHFWSLHRGGGCFLAADGSARFLSYSVAPLLPALATRAGGEVATWPD